MISWIQRIYVNAIKTINSSNLLQRFQHIWKPSQDSQHLNIQKSKKMKVGIFFGYNGEKFQGMQYQKQHNNTIQYLLHRAIIERGLVLQTNTKNLERISWTRGARTDKKVHALCNGVSTKIQIYPKHILKIQGERVIPNFDKIKNQLNLNLPQDIRVFRIQKLGKKFNMRQNPSSRTYNYIIPAKLFLPYHQFKNGNLMTTQKVQQLIQDLNAIMKLYLGSHNFYNFTKGYKPRDPQCQRVVLNVKVQLVDPNIIKETLKKNSIQEKQQHFIRFTITGQSFIYHQIRKMIGLLVQIYSQQLNFAQKISKAFKKERISIFIAPGQGLYLNRLSFDHYNKKPTVKHQIEFTQAEEKQMIQYRGYLQTKIINHEFNEKIFSQWIIDKFQSNYNQLQKQQE